MKCMHAYFLLFALAASSANAAPIIKHISTCGTVYAPPYANPKDSGPRKCADVSQRKYMPLNSGIGFDILNLESAACFVPDTSYELLDSIVLEARARIKKEVTAPITEFTKVKADQVSRIVGDILARRNFGLYIPTETLGDALEYRNATSEPERHIVDCDTASFIYLTVAEAVGLPAHLVEITLPSGSGHNYVRWQLSSGQSMDWDTNGRAQCVAPTGIPDYQGKNMSQQQVMGYAYGVRADLRGRHGEFNNAVIDYLQSIKLYPESPGSFNNLAWMISTKEFPERESFRTQAITAAKRAVEIENSANNLDTLACAHAVNKDYLMAISIEKKALVQKPQDEFKSRLKLFENEHDCTGID